jgi:Transposase DDE domain
VETQVCRRRRQVQRWDLSGLERQVRQLLADKVSGNLAGIWLLIPEHLRLGTWDLLCGWTGRPTQSLEPRLAMQLVHEAAICTIGVREDRTLRGRGGFELANGLPFVATDTAIHELLKNQTVADTMQLQATLGKIRRASGHFSGKLLAIDPHRIASHSRRHIRRRVEKHGSKPQKMAQTFWALDAETAQPVCFTTATASRSVVDATPELIGLAAQILQPAPGQTLVVADSEHFSSKLLKEMHQQTGFDLLVPVPNLPAHRKRWAQVPEDRFTRRWAGFATAKVPYEVLRGEPGEYFEFIQRTGERPEDWCLKSFMSTADGDEVDRLTQDYPQRWHIEEFFNANQSLGWNRAGTLNLNIRYAQMTLALLAQAAIHQLRQRLGNPFSTWDSKHLASDLFFRLEGDVRVTADTVLVTYYNAPNADQLEETYANLPDKLSQDGVDPQIPWLYGYKLDFRFR